MRSDPTPVRTAARWGDARVSDIMTADVVVATGQTSVARIAELMDEKAISGMPVVDEGNRVIGIVTDFDLIVRNTRIRPPTFLPLLDGLIPLESPGHFRRRIQHMVGMEAKDVMTQDVVTIGPDEEVEKLAELMVKAGINLLPVVEHGRLVGVVSRSDVVRWMARRDQNAPAPS